MNDSILVKGIESLPQILIFKSMYISLQPDGVNL